MTQPPSAARHARPGEYETSLAPPTAPTALPPHVDYSAGYAPVQAGDFVAPRLIVEPRRKGRGALIALLVVALVAGGGAIWWFKYRPAAVQALACDSATAGIESNAGFSATLTPGVAVPTGIPLPASKAEVTCGGTLSNGFSGVHGAVTILGWRDLDQNQYQADLVRQGWFEELSEPPCTAYIRTDKLHVIVVCSGDVQVVGYVVATAG